MKAKTMRSWNLNAANLEDSVRFYQDLFGGEVTTRHQVRGVDVVRLRVGDFAMGLFDASAGDSPGVPHHTFAIDGPDDPAELQRELEGRGFVVDHVREHRDGAGYSLYIDDPNGKSSGVVRRAGLTTRHDSRFPVAHALSVIPAQAGIQKCASAHTVTPCGRWWL